MNDNFSAFSLQPSAFVFLIALALDRLLGEPPNTLHPVAWMGRWIGGWEQRAPTAPLVAFIYGLLIVGAGLLLTIFIAVAFSLWLRGFNQLVYVLGSAWLLKTTFAYRALTRAAMSVQAALRANDLPEARRLLAWHLVSRDTSQLDECLVSAATIESVAENFSDGIVAPLFYFALFGVPGALAYRFANTADAMLGYHDARREHLGKFAARLDDALNLIPSRLAALMLIGGAAILKYRDESAVTRADTAQAWRIMWRDHARTASPNAGWPMSAMAGALGVTLEKVDHYHLGDGDGVLNADAIGRSLRVMGAACVVDWVMMVWALVIRHS